MKPYELIREVFYRAVISCVAAYDKEAFVDQILSAIEADDCGKHPLHPGTGNNPAKYDEDIWAARLAEYQEYQQELKSDLMSVDEKSSESTTPLM